MWWHSKFLLHHSLREKDLLPELPPNAFICVSCFSSSSTIIQGHLGTREKPSSKALEINMLSIMSVLYSEKNLIYELPPPPPKDIYHSLMKYSVQFSHSDLANSLRHHGQQHTRLPCPSPVPEIVQTHVHQAGDAIQHLILCHPLLCLSSIFPSIRGFSNESALRWLIGGQGTGVSASASVLPMNIQDWFPLGWTGWVSLQSKGRSRVISSTTVQKH